MLRLVLVALIFVLPNMLRFSGLGSSQGLNVFNILYVVAIVLLLTKGKSRVSAASGVPLLVPIFLFWGISLLSFFIARSDGSGSMEDVVFLKNHVAYMSLYFIAFGASGSEKDRKILYYAFLATTAIAGLQAFRQGLAIGASQFSVGARVSGPFGDDWRMSNFAGIYFSQFIPLLYAQILYSKSLLSRGGLALAFLVSVAGLFFTYSRKSYYALAMAIGLVSSMASKAAFVGILAVIMSFPIWAPEQFVERLLGEQSEVVGAMSEEFDESTQSRFILWNGAMDMFQDHPFGVGLERFKQNIGQYSVYSHMDAHNYYVLVLAEMGFLGLSSLLLLMAALIRESLRLARAARLPIDRTLARGFAGSLCAMMIVNTFGSPFNFGEIMGGFWILCGVATRARVEASALAGASSVEAEDGESVAQGG